MEYKHIHRLIHVLIFLSLVVPMPASAQSTSAPQLTPKLQDYLTKLAEEDPTERVALIVQTTGTRNEVEAVVRKNGGRITKALPMINAFAVVGPASLLVHLAATKAVTWVSLDTPVMSQRREGSGAVSAQDDFTTMAYNGNNGTFAWQGNWEEVGEADGAEHGDVAVTSFWGGALQGLRLQGNVKGAWRQLDLSQTEQAQISVAYRRKSFISESDYVTLELSADGGLTWTEVTRWGGLVTDDTIQYETYDISAYRSAQTSVRFITAPGLAQDARFYLDLVQIDFLPTWHAEELAASTLYLPLVTNGGDGFLTQADTVNALAKQDRLRHTDDARASCLYRCIDLFALLSTYVKAIDAAKLWNSWPYLRGDGVTVAVVDSGISPHLDFNDYYGNSRVIKRVNFVPGAGTPDDYYGHGTHIAGTIAGMGQSSGGKYMGVAPEAKLVDVKVMDDWGYGNTSDVVAGLQWIYDNRSIYNIKVVNLSLNSRVMESYHESALDAALEVLWFNKIVVVVSAGNGGKQRLYPPANDPFVITVGAADDKGTTATLDDALPSFSAYGMTGDGFLKPDLVAPGTNIVAPLSSDDNNLAWTHPENKVSWPYANTYYRMSGTSMAAAVTAGAVALLLEDEPALTPDQVKYRLKSTALPFSRGESCATGVGYLDIDNAVNGFTSQSANTGVRASQLLSTGANPITWGSVSWNSVSWNSVSWNSVSWNSVSWNSVSWNSVSWNSRAWGNGNGNGSCNAALKKLMLVNADTNREIQPLYDGAIVDLDAIGTKNLAVQAETTGNVESVKFDLDGGFYTKVENVAPYTLANPTGDDFRGSHKLKVTTYPYDNATGIQGAELEVQFVVAGAHRCELESDVRSESNTTPMRFTVDNNTSVQLQLFWLDYKGQRQSYGTVAPGKKWSITTYVTHPWVIARDVDDVCVRLVPEPSAEAKVKVATIFNGTYKLLAVHSNKALDVSGASTADGANVQQWGYGGGANQKWRIEPAGNDYRLLSVNSNNCLDVNGSSTADGANVLQWSCHNGNNQRWRIEPMEGGAFRLVSVNSNKCLDVNGAAIDDGGNVIQWTCTGANNQKWLITPVN